MSVRTKGNMAEIVTACEIAAGRRPGVITVIPRPTVPDVGRA